MLIVTASHTHNVTYSYGRGSRSFTSSRLDDTISQQKISWHLCGKGVSWDFLSPRWTSWAIGGFHCRSNPRELLVWYPWPSDTSIAFIPKVQGIPQPINPIFFCIRWFVTVRTDHSEARIAVPRICLVLFNNAWLTIMAISTSPAVTLIDIMNHH